MNPTPIGPRRRATRSSCLVLVLLALVPWIVVGLVGWALFLR